MKLIFALILSVGLAAAQGVIPWNHALSAPGIAMQQMDGVFYVAAYSTSGTHTDYDMARQAADAYAAAHPWTGSVLILKPTYNQTCDAVPLPSLGTSGGKWGTTSIVGMGSNLSSIVKRPGCPASAATFSHQDSPAGQLSSGWYQGFTVNANHIDSAACEVYGMSLTTFLDIACGNAIAGADHELDFGNRDANFLGWMDNIYIYNLRTFDTVGVGKGAVLTPVWTLGQLAGVTVTNAGTKAYSKYVRAQLIGPDLSTCSTIPTLTPTLGSNSYINGATITNAGSCTSTARLYVLIQDGTPVTYGLKFSNMADSHVWNLESVGSYAYGEAWLRGSNNNAIYGEHPYTNQTIQIADYGNGNRHLGPFFDSPGAYGAYIYGQNGTIENAVFSWDSTSYVGASGYMFGNDPRVYQSWMIHNSQCTNSTSNFVTITTMQGVLPTTLPPPTGIKLRDVEACDGSNMLNWPSSK